MVVTRAERTAGTSATDVIARLLGPLREVAVDRSIAERAGRVCRETGIRLPDALSAATEIERKLGLASRNTRDFDRVRGLRTRDWGRPVSPGGPSAPAQP